ncbi:MAG: metallopeptidase family protein [Nitrospiraceae bacterium]
MRSQWAHRLTVTDEEFEAWVREALDGLPDEYAKLAAEVTVVVEPEPSKEVLADLKIDDPNDLLGLYQGHSLAEVSFFQSGGTMPARISIYRKPILHLCRSKKAVIQEVRDTVVHELGHHVGLDDDEMPY